MIYTSIKMGFLSLLLFCPPSLFALTLSDYTDPDAKCFERANSSHLIVADGHLHYRPFGGPAVDFNELITEVKKQGVLFTSVFGIGQKLSYDAPPQCESYLDCVGEPVLPSIRNDYTNVEIALDNDPEGIELVFSMTSFDLSSPETIPDLIAQYDKEYPGLFKLAGESNLVKQALFPNGHIPVTEDEIDNWAPFMKILKERDIPIALHSDLGNDTNKFEYQNLIEKVLKTYPDNKVIWLHLGISGELTDLSPFEHLALLETLMIKYPNLYLDLSWGSVLKPQFIKNTTLYSNFLNVYSGRVITGSDYVAYKNKTDEHYNYLGELELSSFINKYLDDNAFRDIALGQSYLNLVGLSSKYTAPSICNNQLH